MLINKSRINSIDKYIAPFKKKEGLYVAIEINTCLLIAAPLA